MSDFLRMNSAASGASPRALTDRLRVVSIGGVSRATSRPRHHRHPPAETAFHFHSRADIVNGVRMKTGLPVAVRRRRGCVDPLKTIFTIFILKLDHLGSVLDSLEPNGKST